MRKKYETDLTDEQWEVIAPLFVNMRNRNPNPTYALIDSQSVKTIYAADQRGFDGEKNKRKEKTYRNRYSRLLVECNGTLSKDARYKVGLLVSGLGYFVLSDDKAILCRSWLSRNIYLRHESTF